MIINDLDGYYIVFDTKNWNTELDTLPRRSRRTDCSLVSIPRRSRCSMAMDSPYTSRLSRMASWYASTRSSLK